MAALGRQQGPTKGLVVIENPESAESILLELEPYVCANSTEYNDILNGTKKLCIVAVDDQLGIKHMEFDDDCTASGG